MCLFSATAREELVGCECCCEGTKPLDGVDLIFDTLAFTVLELDLVAWEGAVLTTDDKRVGGGALDWGAEDTECGVRACDSEELTGALWDNL